MESRLADAPARRHRSPAVRPSVLAVSKTNVGRQPPALGYRVVESAGGLPVVEWTGPVDLTADGLCAGEAGGAELQARDRAIDWLRRELAAGPRKAAELYAAAAEAGIPERTLERAKAELRARSHRAYDHKRGQRGVVLVRPGRPVAEEGPVQEAGRVAAAAGVAGLLNHPIGGRGSAEPELPGGREGAG